jgi:hypothetical protein
MTASSVQKIARITFVIALTAGLILLSSCQSRSGDTSSVIKDVAPTIQSHEHETMCALSQPVPIPANVFNSLPKVKRDALEAKATDYYCECVDSDAPLCRL